MSIKDVNSRNDAIRKGVSFFAETSAQLELGGLDVIGGRLTYENTIENQTITSEVSAWIISDEISYNIDEKKFKHEGVGFNGYSLGANLKAVAGAKVELGF